MKHSFSKVAAVMMASMMALSACAPPQAGDSQTTAAATTAAAEKKDDGSSEAAKTEEPAGEVTITMAMTAPWDTFIPFNTTNANTDCVLELMYDKIHK